MSRVAEPRAFLAFMPGTAWVRDVATRVIELGLAERLGGAAGVVGEFAPIAFRVHFFSDGAGDRGVVAGGGSMPAHACTLHFNRIAGRAFAPEQIHWTMRARGLPSGFTALLREVQGRLVQAGLGQIATRVTPHMTLSYRAPEPLDKIVLVPPIGMIIDELCLVIGGGHPYRYDIVGRWPLLPEIDPPATQPGLF